MNAHHHIISIGASETSIDEIASFFVEKPLAGVAYVIIQQLPSDFRTRLAEILAKHLHLAIHEAQNGVLVETDHVYIIPDDRSMTIRKGRLWITEKAQDLGLHQNTDNFFAPLRLIRAKKRSGLFFLKLEKMVLTE